MDLTAVGGSLGGIEGGGIDIPRDRASSVKKNAIKPWQKRMWCIPAPANVAFVCQMETVLAVYRRTSDPAYPVVRMDEISVQCTREARDPIYRPNLGRANATT